MRDGRSWSAFQISEANGKTLGIRLTKGMYGKQMKKNNNRPRICSCNSITMFIREQAEGTIDKTDRCKPPGAGRQFQQTSGLLSRHAPIRACQRHGIEHRLTKPNQPWTNGQVERMNRTIKEATVQRYCYESHGQLRRHLDHFAAPTTSLPTEDPQGPHALRVHLQGMDQQSRTIQSQSAPANAGTKHLSR